MFSNAASPASDTLPEELSKLGIAIPDQALQRIIEAVTLAITPRVSSADTPKGAKASALLYSLVETAKACGVEPYCWLAYVLKRLPLAETADAYDQLMPWNIKPEDLITDIGR